MSARRGMQVVGGLLLAVAAVFGFFLASQAAELYQLISNWSVKENYFHDVFNVCKLFLWALGAFWCYQTFCSGLNLVSHEEKRPQPQNKPQQQGNHNQHHQGGGQGHGQQNRVPQQQLK
jgi:hypothetical protein